MEDTLKEMKDKEEYKFDKEEFDQAFSKFDTDGNGTISKQEMLDFLKKVAGYDEES